MEMGSMLDIEASAVEKSIQLYKRAYCSGEECQLYKRAAAGNYNFIGIKIKIFKKYYIIF